MHAESRRITILTYGTRGDVEPFVALGIGLQGAGHAVRLAAPAEFAALAQGRGLEFAPLKGSPAQLASALAGRAGLSWPRMVAEMMGHVLPLARRVYHGAAEAVRDSELIVHSFLMTDAGHTLARLQGVPDVSAQFFPVFLPTAAFPAVVAPDLRLGGIYRRATHLLTGAVFRYGSRLAYRRLSASAPELPELASWPFSGVDAGRTPILLAYDPHLLPRPHDWPSYAHITGYWQLEPAREWTPPRDLVRFLASGAPPVYLGTGSMETDSLLTLLEAGVSAARACGQRLILGVSCEKVTGDLIGPDILAVEGVPHAWLFAQMRYILHHGGAGTTGAAATAGVPNSAMPFTADQAFWARVIHRQGLGPAGVPARRLTRERLEAMVREVIAEPAYGRRAAALGEKMRSTEGVRAAVRIVEEHLA